LEGCKKVDLKPPGQKSWVYIVADGIWHRRGKRILAILLYTLFVFVLGAFIYRTGIIVNITSKFQDNASAIPKLPGNVVRGLQAEPDRITIDIQHENFMRLAYQREVALANGYLVTNDADYVPANISHNGESVRVRIRLKGDFLDHLNTDKWSYRIKVRGDNTLFGMKEFSIQHPKTRNYVYEWIYHRALRKEGVISLRYEFVDVTLNGKHLGIYALEEHFDKLLIEHNELREGPIIRFNENLLFAERFQQLYSYPKAKVNGNSSFQAADIDSFQTNRILSDPVLYAHQEQAMRLLESFRQGKLPTSAVFDILKLARFFAINDLMGAQHSESWQNLRFYYNPITSRLEPIGFDGDSGQSIRAVSSRIGSEVGPEFIEAVFDDQLFFEMYIRTLERVSQPTYLHSLLADLDKELRQNLNIIYRDYPYYNFSTDVLFRNQQYIETVLNPIKGLHAYFRKVDENNIELELGNIQSLPVKVVSVSYGDSTLSRLDEPVVLPPSVLEVAPVDYHVVPFTLPQDFQ
jgi:hypothetical protein